MSALPGSRDDDTAALLAPLFALDDRVPTSQLAIPLPRARLLEALGRLLARMLGNATALVVEDLHWADPSTLEVLDELAHRHAELRIPIVLTARVMPPLAPRLRDRIEAIELAPLDEATAAKLADAIVASRDDDARRETCAEPRAERTTRDADAVIDAQAIREMLRVAEGIPLFIVEQARSLSARATGHRAAVADGLQDLLAARLDEAGADKALLQAAAVIGVEFTRARLRGLTGGTGGPIDEAIDRLTKVSLLEAGVRGASEARFSHALLQRAALESLPRGRRSDLHRRYAALLQDDAKSGLEAPDAIAWHLHEGGLPAEAARWWLRAARRAVRQAAYAEAAGLAERALAALETTPDRGAFDDVAFAALLLGAYAYVALGGYYDARAQQWYERAYRLTRRPDADPRKLLGALRGHWVGASSRASHREAKAIAGQMIGIARAAGLAWLHGVACYLAGNSALWLGEFDAAFALLNEAVDVLRRAPRDADALLAHEQDFEVTATGYLAWAHWYLGRTELALELGRRALQRAQESADVPTWLHTAVTCCSIAMGARKPAEVMEISAQIVDRALRHELAMWADIGRLQHHWARACLGDETHTGLAVDALERLCTNYPGGAAGFQCILAESFLFLGDDQRVHRALAALRDSLQQTEAGAFSATLHRLEGELATREGRSRDAGAAFHRAVELAIAQGSPALEAQARTAQIGAEPSVAIWS